MNYSYLAGFIDADGSITVPHSKKVKGQYGLIVYIGNTNKIVMGYIAQFLKSKLKQREQHNNLGTLTTYYIALSGKKAASLLKKVYHHLIIKKRRAKYALILNYFIGLHCRGGIRKVPFEELEIREKLRQIICLHAYQDKGMFSV